MIAISVIVFLALLANYLHAAHKRLKHNDSIDALAKQEFAKRVRYIRFLETVTPDKCERCNHKKRLRGVLTLARLCHQCQIELGLHKQY